MYKINYRFIDIVENVYKVINFYDKSQILKQLLENGSNLLLICY